MANHSGDTASFRDESNRINTSIYSARFESVLYACVLYQGVPLFGAIPYAQAASIVVRLSISVIPSSGMWTHLAGARFIHESPNRCKNPNNEAKIR